MATDSTDPGVQECRVCGCTNLDCRGCIRRTGRPCWWVEDDLCSACQAGAAEGAGWGDVGDQEEH